MYQLFFFPSFSSLTATAILEEGVGDDQVPAGGDVLPEPAGREECGHQGCKVVPLFEGPEALRVHEEGRERRQGKVHTSTQFDAHKQT